MSPFDPVVADNPPIWNGTRAWFLAEGFLVTPGRFPGQTYTLGDRGRVFVEALIRLPLPVWAMPSASPERGERVKCSTKKKLSEEFVISALLQTASGGA